MSLHTVVTSFSERGWEEYGQACVRSFKAHWPASVRLICYWENKRPPGVWEGWNLELTEPCASFIARHADNQIVQGKSQSALSPWGPKARAHGYSFRHDAFKFGRKVFAIAHASRHVELGKLFWLDADVVTNNPVPETLLDDLLPDDVSLSYLARPRSYSELGFVGYNLNRLETHSFITAYEAMFSEDGFLALPHWTDCHVFDHLVEKLSPVCGLIAHSNDGQPLDHSVLGQYMTHYKGPRKKYVVV